MPDVLCFGEALIDFVAQESGVPLAEAKDFEKNAGGAPANVAVGLARLGASSGFMGKVGADDFGLFLARTLAVEGVETGGLEYSYQARTGLAFVSVGEDGEREFLFYRHPSADMLHTPEEVDGKAAVIRAAARFHLGSNSLTREPARSATLRALEIARQSGCRISYDPNIRPHMWPDLDAARAGVMGAWPFAEVIKLSEVEVDFLTGGGPLEQGVRGLWHDGLRLVVVTQGDRGCRYFTLSGQGHVDGFVVQVVDTTGAGDGFMAGMLFKLVRDPGLMDAPERLPASLRFANATGALTVTGRGAMRCLPGREAVEALLNESRNLHGSQPRETD